MTKTELAIRAMEELAKDNSHGYDQIHRWGPDYDCSSAVITSWEIAGVPVHKNAILISEIWVRKCNKNC